MSIYENEDLYVKLKVTDVNRSIACYSSSNGMKLRTFTQRTVLEVLVLYCVVLVSATLYSHSTTV